MTTPLPIPTGEDHPSFILIFGGTFDPVHIGHVKLPVQVRDELERRSLPAAARGWLLYVPAARSPLKNASPVASDADRSAMLGLALQGIPRAAVWTDELDRSAPANDPADKHQPSYTVDTLRRAREWLDNAGLTGVPLRLLIGADQAVSFHRWRDPRDLLRLAKPAVMVRGDAGSVDLVAKKIEEQDFWNPSELAMWREAVVPVGPIDVSATRVRQALRMNDRSAIKSLLPTSVAKYIASHGLYTKTEP